MPKILRTKTGFLPMINGVVFSQLGEHSVSEDMSDEAAEQFLAVPGYELVATPAPANEPALSVPVSEPKPEAPAADPAPAPAVEEAPVAETKPEAPAEDGEGEKAVPKRRATRQPSKPAEAEQEPAPAEDETMF